MADSGIIKLISQPVCIINKDNKGITYGNPAMLKVLNVVGRTFDICFSFVDKGITFQSSTASISENPVLIKVSNSSSYYYGYWTHQDKENVILVLTPCLLKQKIVDNQFLRNHEQVVDCLENAPLAIHISEPSGQFLWANDFTRKLTGFDQSELTKRKYSDVSILIYMMYILLLSIKYFLLFSFHRFMYSYMWIIRVLNTILMIRKLV